MTKNSLKLEKLILNEVNDNIEVISFIKKYFDLNNKKTHIIHTVNPFNINVLKRKNVRDIINLKKINDARFINKFFEEVNQKLSISNLFFGCVETYPNRRKVFLSKYPFLFNWVIYIIDYLFRRILPRLFLTKKIYFLITKGRGRVLSRAEILGRLYSCGFEVVDEKNIDNKYYFIVRKIKEPAFDKKPTYGALIGLNRIGKNKKEFIVYKLRTMHPYSEYLQDYIYKKNNLQDGGKIKNDFRISPEGRFFRKFWIDELPMLFNLLKGDMKLVGVRPLSPHYFNLYSKEIQNLRTQFKPGLIPPFYVDMPKTMDEIMESEKKYLDLYKKSPIMTDIKYFFTAIRNILFKGARSN